MGSNSHVLGNRPSAILRYCRPLSERTRFHLWHFFFISDSVVNVSLSLPFPISHPRTLPRTRTPHSLGSSSSCHKTASLSFVFQVSSLSVRGPFRSGRLLLRSSSVYGLLIGLERARDGEISNLESLDHFGRDSAPLTNEPPRVILTQISRMRHLLIFSH